MKKAALIDIGNVILLLDFETSLARLVPPELADPEGRIQSLLERKDELESGVLKDDEFVAWASRKLQFTGPKDDFLTAWNDIFTLNTAMAETLRDLKSRGVRLILFSNTNQMHVDYFTSAFPEVFGLFEGSVFSHEVGANKPDPAIFQHALDKYKLEAAETLYIDDLPENITTGLQMGFSSWRYSPESHEAMTRWLVSMLD
jgi:putative hydrolase of the HAD superfamily